MTDRRAVKNTFQRGITAEEHYGVENLHDGGIPDNQGVPIPSESKVQGIPMWGDAPIPYTPTSNSCLATTKEGNPCKAFRVRSEHLCIGHLRADGQRRDTESDQDSN